MDAPESEVNRTANNVFIENEMDLRRMKEERNQLKRVYDIHEKDDKNHKPLSFLILIVGISLAWALADYFHHHLPDVDSVPSTLSFSPVTQEPHWWKSQAMDQDQLEVRLISYLCYTCKT